MKKTLLMGSILAIFMSHNAWAACNNNQVFSTDPNLVNQKLTRNTYEVCFEEYTVVYSGLSKTPLWSAEHLTPNRIAGAHEETRVNSFHPESAIPASVRSVPKDYAKTGYDKGHMSPSGDMDNDKAQFESFSMSNMIPQNPNNNRVLWRKIETAVRKLVSSGHDVYVVTGPIFGGNQALPGGELIPTQIFKAVYDTTTNTAGAYVVNNANGNFVQVVSINDLQNLSGIDVFPSVSPSVKSVASPLPNPSASSGRKSKKSGWW